MCGGVGEVIYYCGLFTSGYEAHVVTESEEVKEESSVIVCVHLV